jgi:V/A-type H+/Na+-transporting ATPase subunit D
MSERIAATRMNLLRASRRLGRVAHGVGLLRRKREALVVRLFSLARPAADARTLIADRTRRAFAALLPALARQGRGGLRSVGWPTRELMVTVEAESVWGIPVSTIREPPTLVRTLAARGTAPGGVGPATVVAAAEFEALTELLLQAAPQEALLRRLGDALARTSRQVNTLELRVAPGLRAQVTGVARTLEEREREEQVRLKRLRHRNSHRPFTVDSTPPR